MNRHTDAIIAIYILMIFFIYIAPFIEYSNIEYSRVCLGVSEITALQKTNNIYNVIQFPHYGGYNATLAQSVERFTRNEKVAGSIPAGGLN